MHRAGAHTCVVVVNLVNGSIRNGKATCLWVLWTTFQPYLGLLTLNTSHGTHIHRLGEVVTLCIGPVLTLVLLLLI